MEMAGCISSRYWPTSLQKPTAISTLSSVGLCSSSSSIWPASISCWTCWLMRWARKVVDDRQTALSFLLKPLRNCITSLLMSSSPTWGSFVLTMAAMAA